MITGETGAGKSILVDALALLAGGRGDSELIREGAERLSVAGEFDGIRRVRALLAQAGLPGVGSRCCSGASSRRTAAVAPSSRTSRPPCGRWRASASRPGRDPRPERRAGADGGRRSARAAGRLRPDARRSARPSRPRRSAGRRRGRRSRRWRTRGASARAPGDAGVPDPRDRGGRLRSRRTRRRAAGRARAAPARGPDPPVRRGGPARPVRGRGLRRGPAGRGGARLRELAAIDPRDAVAPRRGGGAQAANPRPRRGRAGRRALDRGRPGAADRAGDPSGAGRAAEAQVRRNRGGGPAPRGRTLRAEAARPRRHRRGAGSAPARGGGGAKDLSPRRPRRSRPGAARRLRGSRRRSRRSCAGSPSRRHACASRSKSCRAASRAPRGRSRPRSSSRPTRASRRSRWSGSRRAASSRACSWRSGRSAAGRARRGRTLIFDEVDAGIGGRVAEVVGKKLRALAQSDQVLCVTHVPQIAALADRHFLAEKRGVRGRTVASVRRLEGKERIAEIARMLAGEKVPETALKHARTLLEAAPKRVASERAALPLRSSSRESARPGRSGSAGSPIVFVGVGAVGAAAAEIAVRAGFGRVTVVDRDVVEPSNLSRQFLFDADDAEARAAQGGGRRRAPGRDRRRGARPPGRRGPGAPQRARRSWPATIWSSMRPTTSRRGCWSRTRAARSGLSLDLRRVRRRGGAGRRLRAGSDAVPALLPRGAAAARIRADLRHGRRRAVASARWWPRSR